MATLSDAEFQAEMANLLSGKDSKLGSLKETPAPAPAVEPAAPAADPGAAAPAEPATTGATAAAEPAMTGAAAAVEPAKTPAEKAADPVQAADPAQVADPAAKKAGDEPAKQPAQADPAAAAVDPAAAAAPVVVEPDYKAIHAAIFGKPIKAGGSEITLTSAEEVVSLVQKGVGFHKKMNAVQKDVAIAETLRQAGIDQQTLNLLIDAQKGKPGAIKKLLDSAKLDPLTLDTPEASNFAPSDHSISETQIRFKSAVDDLTGTSHGTAILTDAQGWDQASKAEVFNTPDMLMLLAHQKENGVYDKIKANIERQKVLGYIPPNESFLVSYARVGQQMQKNGDFGAPAPTPAPAPAPVVQKVLTPAAPANPKQAAAAAPTRSSPAPKVTADPLAGLSDAEFEKKFKATYKI